MGTNIDVVILAAGFSSRANGFKLEFEIENKKILEKCIEVFEDDCNKIIVVAGFRADKIYEMVNKYTKVEVIINENYEKGMFSSVKKGLINTKSNRIFITPGDYPFLEKHIIKKILSMDEEIVIPIFKGKKGHPLLIKSKIIDEILQYSDDFSLKDYINSKKYSTIEVDSDSILIDVDTQEDYIKAKKDRWKGGEFNG